MTKTVHKTAAIYDRWLFTLGGGEQVAFAYAECLRNLGFKTTLLTHQEIDVEKARQKMDVDLTNIEIRYLPLMSATELSECTEGYDVFINTSYLDYFPNRSKFGILSVFFPGRISLSPYEYLKRAVVLPSFSRFFIYPSLFEGFKYDDWQEGRIHKWLGKKSSVIFNQDVRLLTIELYFVSYAISLIEGITFYLGDKQITPVKHVMKHEQNIVQYTFELSHARHKKFEIHMPENPNGDRVALVRLTIRSVRYMLYNLFKLYFPKWEMRLHGGPGVTKLSDLTSYHQVITISEFSRFWIRKYWGLDSQILYPPVSTQHFSSSSRKKNWIVHVGRFFVTGHCKKQLDLVKSFRKLVDEYEVKGWELHFVGSVHEGDNHRAYFERVKALAEGYPVVFHLDATFDELHHVLSQSKIYWHATGLDEDESRSPILFEHFGITTVEAMASGCVPVVICAGGQKEIVTENSGFLWKTRKELLEYTWELIKDRKLLTTMSVVAQKRSAYFSRNEFAKRFKLLLHNEIKM